MLKTFCKNEKNVFEILPTLKDIINIIEENEDGEPIYQVQKLKRYLHKKQCIKNQAVEIVENVEKIVGCFEQRFSSVYWEDAESFNKVAFDGDIIFAVCLTLNTIWPKLDDNTNHKVV